MSTKVFEDKSGMPVDGTDYRYFQRNTMAPAAEAVAVTMTPEAANMYRPSSYPASDAMSVHNITRNRRGHGY